jgi:hypothetical protein
MNEPFVSSGSLQESDRRDYIRPNVSVLHSYRFVQRSPVVADLPGSVLLRSGDHALGEITMADINLRQHSSLRFELICFTC